MPKVQYPLKQVLEVKIRRVEEAEKVVLEKRMALEKEQKKLKEREAERDKVLKHHDDKLKQLREEMDRSTTSPKIQQMKVYLKVVQEKVVIEEKKVTEQKGQVAAAEKNLEAAINDLRLKRQEVDKLETHKIDWEKQMSREEAIEEGKEQDELGSVMYLIHKKQKEEFL